MASVYLYFLVSIIFFYLFIFFVHSYKKNKNRNVFYYALTFLFTFLICFFNSVPLLATNDLRIAAYGNVVSNIFLYCLVFTCFKVQMMATDKFFKNNVTSLNIILLIIAIISTGFQLTYLSEPKISLLSIVWNLNSITSTLLLLTTFIYGIYWGIVFGKIAHILRDPFLKRRMYMIAVNGVLFGLSGLFLFQNAMYLTAIGIFSLLLAAIASCIVFLIPEHQNKTSNDLATA